MHQTKRSIIVEGWRFIAHSYAITNQWQLLALLKRGDIAIKIRDMPFYGVQLDATSSVFDPIATHQLHSIQQATADECADLTLRWYAPYDFSPSNSPSTAVFGTAEYQCIPRSHIAHSVDISKVSNLKVVTPSNWSAKGFHRLGFAPEQIVVLPHSVDVDAFRPQPEEREKIRTLLSLGLSILYFSTSAR
jgi:hypothetical protein